MRHLLGLMILLLGLLQPIASMASDHADPTWLPADEQEANLTGLFFFEDGDRYVAILDTRPTLTVAPPYHLNPYKFAIDIDTHSPVTFTKPSYKDSAEKQLIEGNLARYGGTVDRPEGVDPNISFNFWLNDDTSLRDIQIKGLKTLPVKTFTDSTLAELGASPEKFAESIWVYTGVRDDPFIFPKFFNSNIITMMVSVPKSAFQTTSTDWLLWGVSKWDKTGEKIDHVGRSNRTQLARFDILNPLGPADHVKALKDAQPSRIGWQDFFKSVARPLANLNQLSGFLLRSYDFAPDVMIYSSRLPGGFPNGRKLTDDVAVTTCEHGDCPLLENSYVDSSRYPRATVNDKPFLPNFPYLAEHWPWRPQPFVGSPWTYFRDNLLAPLLWIIAGLVVVWLLWRWLCRWARTPRIKA